MKRPITQSLKRSALAIYIGLGFAVSAQAGLVGVKTIEVSNAIGTWLQVAEVQAFNTASLNVARDVNGAVASAPDTWEAASSPAQAIDGNTAGNHPNIFHEGSDFSHDTLTITLAAIEELNSFSIWGRTDCCSDRDIYSVVFKDSQGATLFTATGLDASGTNHVAGLAFPNAQAVPEPTTVALLGLGLLGIAGMHRRTTRKD